MLDTDVRSDDQAGNEEQSHTRRMIDLLARNWPRRAQVKKAELEPLFVPGQEDFLESLLPFRDMPQYRSCSPELRSRVLSCGWLMYNAKTTQIENEIVNPICLDIIAGQLPGLNDEGSQLAVSETMVDEVYHIHLVERSSRLTRRHRGLEHLAIPQFNLVRHMRRRQDEFSEPWQKRIVQFATAAVSEIFISDYLHLLSEAEEIQPFNRETVAAHRHDEMVHGTLFRSLTGLFTAELTPTELALFAEILPEPVTWFADRELDIWLALLEQIEFPQAAEMIRETRAVGAVDLTALDYAGVVSLARELGMLETAVGREAFLRRGLLPAASVAGGDHHDDRHGIPDSAPRAHHFCRGQAAAHRGGRCAVADPRPLVRAGPARLDAGRTHRSRLAGYRPNPAVLTMRQSGQPIRVADRRAPPARRPRRIAVRA
jgi:alpha-N-dichloroacetyl-p-aminophenylserinol N-oxygenase